MAKKILIIDDEEKIREMLSLRLKANKYDVIMAENGLVGLDKVKSEKPDLIILDVMMPVMDGFEFFKTIKKEPQLSQTPILVLTARGAMKDTFEAFDADDFIPKPFDSNELVSRVSFLLANNALVLSSDPYATEKINNALKKNGYNPCEVHEMDELAQKGKESKFKAIVIHLALFNKEPKLFLDSVKMFKYNSPKIIIFCDAKVKGTENNDTVAIEDYRLQWKKVGIESFFDARMTGESLSKLFAGWLA